MCSDIEAPKIPVMVERVLIQRREFASFITRKCEYKLIPKTVRRQTKQKQFATTRRGSDDSMSRPRSRASLGNEFAPFVLILT